MSGPTIRTAQPEDLAAILRLLRLQLDDQSIEISDDALRHATGAIIADPALGRILVASDDGGVIGVAVLSFLWTLEHGGAAVWLDDLYVEPQYRGRGLGERLIAAAIAVARERGCLALDLEVEPGHDAAERLYERLGFHRHRRVRWAYKF